MSKSGVQRTAAERSTTWSDMQFESLVRNELSRAVALFLFEGTLIQPFL